MFLDGALRKASSKVTKISFKSRQSRMTIATIGILVIVFLFVSPGIFVAGYSLKSPATLNSSPYGNQNGLPISLRSSPRAIGCYQYDQARSSWESRPCLPANANLVRPTEGGTYGVNGLASKSDVNYGQIYYYPHAYYGVVDSKYGGGAWSIQANTNGFYTSPGSDLYWVQFTVQNDLDANTNILCIWQVDITTQSYNHDCESIPVMLLDEMSVGYMSGWAYGGNLGAIFCENKVPGNCWEVEESDSIGLESHYYGLTGSVLGYGDGSEVFFTSGSKSVTLETLTELDTSKANSYPSGEINVITLETNNLVYSHSDPIGCKNGWCKIGIYSDL